MTKSLKPGARLGSAVDGTEVVVVRAPATDVELCCGGRRMLRIGEDGRNGRSPELDPRFAGGSVAGNLYVHAESGLEVLCTVGGPGGLSVGSQVMTIKDLVLPENLVGDRPAGTPADMATREKLIVAAAANLAEEGVAGISTRRIATRAGVNPALVHYHFGSIGELMLEVLRRIGIQSLLRLQSQYSTTNDFADQWRNDIATTVDGEVAIGWGKAWIGVISFVMNDDALGQRYVSDLGEPTWEIMRGAVYRELGVDAITPELEEEADGVIALAQLVKMGLIMSAIAGLDRGRAAAVDLAAQLLRERVEEIREGFER